MTCQVCHQTTTGQLCDICRLGLRPSAEKILPGGLRLVTAFVHSGPAVSLMHDLKYRGLTWYADLVAAVVGPRLPHADVVAVPRAWTRYIRYGVDAAAEIGRRLALENGSELLPGLARHLHTPRRAGGDHSPLSSPFRRRGMLPRQVIVVDDVVTTGATLIRAVESVGRGRVAAVVAANDASGLSTLPPNRETRDDPSWVPTARVGQGSRWPQL